MRFTFFDYYNLMEGNKIKHAEEVLDGKNNSFRHFISTIRDRRNYHNTHLFQKQSDRISQITGHHDSQEIFEKSSRQAFSEVHNSSLYLPRDLLNQDSTIKLKSRVGIGSRDVVHNHQLPPHSFHQTQLQLSQFLKNPNVPAVDSFKIDRYEEKIGKLKEMGRVIGGEKPKSLKDANADIVLKFCLLHELESSLGVKQILVFFNKLMALINYHIIDPRIEKFKNCIYFGHNPRKNSFYQGFLYFFSNKIYYGEFYNQQKHGNGVQILVEQRQIFRGEFRQGKMKGYFQVEKDDEKYSGQVRNGQYHGRGKLRVKNQVYEGQFRQGKPEKHQHVQQKMGMITQKQMRIRKSRLMERKEKEGNQWLREYRYPFEETFNPQKKVEKKKVAGKLRRMERIDTESAEQPLCRFERE